MIGEKSRLRSMILVKTCYWLVSTVILSGTRRLPTISSCPDSDAGIRRGLERSWLALVQKWTLRSEEHTSELQSHLNLVCRLLLEKKKKVSSHHARLHTSVSSHPRSS